MPVTCLSNILYSITVLISIFLWISLKHNMPSICYSPTNSKMSRAKPNLKIKIKQRKTRNLKMRKEWKKRKQLVQRQTSKKKDIKFYKLKQNKLNQRKRIWNINKVKSNSLDLILKRAPKCILREKAKTLWVWCSTKISTIYFFAILSIGGCNHWH